MAINQEWALERLRGFLHVTESWHVPPPSGVISAGSYRLVNADQATVQQHAQVIEQILDRVISGWRSEIPERKSRVPWVRHREAVNRAIAQLEAEAELRENLGEDAPQLDASTLHPWVWEGCKTLWASGHFREAVSAAAKVVSSNTQTRVARRDLSDHDLLAQCFSLKPPEAGAPRLRFLPADDSDTYRNRQEGAIALARGLYLGIRNPAAHERLGELPEHEALEQLAAFSILARWVDEATVERV